MAEKRGGVMECAGKLFSALIFFGSFLHQGKKEQEKIV
jgi:hypothetical protein